MGLHLDMGVQKPSKSPLPSGLQLFSLENKTNYAAIQAYMLLPVEPWKGMTFFTVLQSPKAPGGYWSQFCLRTGNACSSQKYTSSSK